MSRSDRNRYYPGPVPTDPVALAEYLEQELYQISQALYPDPTHLSVRASGDVEIGPVENWQNPMIGAAPSVSNPGMSWDSAAGAWTVAESGLYVDMLSAQVSAFSGGNRNYYVGLRLVVDGVPLDTRFAGGNDDVPLQVVLSNQGVLESGQVVTVESTPIHDQFSGTVFGLVTWILRKL